MNAKKIDSHWVSTIEAAKVLGVSRVTVFNRIKKGLIKAEKVGGVYLIAASELRRIMGEPRLLDDLERERIDAMVKRAVEQYGIALQMLGKE